LDSQSRKLFDTIHCCAFPKSIHFILRLREGHRGGGENETLLGKAGTINIDIFEITSSLPPQ
jgi:hypothetical protein